MRNKHQTPSKLKLENCIKSLASSFVLVKKKSEVLECLSPNIRLKWKDKQANDEKILEKPFMRM